MPYQGVMQPVRMLSMVQMYNFEDLRAYANLFSLLRGNRFCRALFTTVLVCLDRDSLLVMWTPRNVMLSTCSTTATTYFSCSPQSSPFVLIRLRERLLPWHHTARSLTYHCCVIGKLNDCVGVVPGRAVMSEQGVQEGTEHAPLRGPCVEEDVLLPTLTTWGVA